jgi:hypothetical protein
VPRKVFGPKRMEMAGDWKKFHDEELYYFYFTLNISCCEEMKEDEMGCDI